MEDVFELLETLWESRRFIIVMIIIVILTLVAEKVLSVIDHSKNVFKGDKKSDD